ncbi:MAG: hypothetical protein F9K23_15935 [Bacteroidetes bacterium]|nr:MAG: hypothetical protein F9K23_15935 [Bacteroidota bacterium]
MGNYLKKLKLRFAQIKSDITENAAYKGVFFIESTTNPGHYLHPDLDAETPTSTTFLLKQGKLGAAVWLKHQAEDMINELREIGVKNLKITPFTPDEPHRKTLLNPNA